MSTQLTQAEIEGITRSCRECKYCIDDIRSYDIYCEAPQLMDLLDRRGNPKNPCISPCDGVRSFKNACSNTANWFEPK